MDNSLITIVTKNKKSWTQKLLGVAENIGLFGYGVTPVRTNNSLSAFDRFFKFFGISVVWGNWNNKDYIQDGFLKNAALYSIVTRICKTAAIAPFRVYKVKDSKKHAQYKNWTGTNATKESMQRAMLLKSDVYEEWNNHPLNKLIDNPNPYQGGNQFTQNSIGFKLLTGNRLWFVKTYDMGANQGRPYELYNLPPQHISLIGGETMWDIAGYVLSLGKYVEIPKEFIIHSKYWNPEFDAMGSHLWGLSPLKAACRNLERSNSAEERAVAMLRNAGAAGVLFNKLATVEDMAPEKVAALKRILNEEVLGLDNAGKIGLANGDLGYINFGLTAVEMNLLEMEKFALEQLCNIYGVPPGLFMASANATDNNIAAWNRQLVSQAVIPALSDLRDDLNTIAAMYKDEIYVDYDISVYPELQEDLEKVQRIMAGSWWIKPNEKRLAMNMDEDMDEPMMNRYLVPQGLVEINDLNVDNLDNEFNTVDSE